VQKASPTSGRVLKQARQQYSRPYPPQVSDAVLVQQALAGKQDAFELLVRRYQPSLNHLIYSYVREYHDACDILQQVLLQLYLSLATLHSEKSIYPWLYRVTRNQCLDHLRRKRPIYFSELDWEREEDDLSPHMPLPDTRPLPEELAERHEVQLHLRAAIAALPARYGSVVYLRYVAGLSFRKIVQALNVPESTAKTRYHRAKRLLRAALSAELEVTLASSY
jgi:RNA polymerase sigma factor (sigma-70 family)